MQQQQRMTIACSASLKSAFPCKAKSCIEQLVKASACKRAPQNSFHLRTTRKVFATRHDDRRLCHQKQPGSESLNQGAAVIVLQSRCVMHEQGDVMLRALRFMDSMIQRDTMQKAAFLNDLATFWDRFDDRVLRLKVCVTWQAWHLMHTV